MNKLCCVVNKRVECPACGQIYCSDCWGEEGKHSPSGPGKRLLCITTSKKIEWIYPERWNNMELKLVGAAE